MVLEVNEYFIRLDLFRFIIFSLLIPYLYQEGEVGRQARDAMVLCMTLSKKNDEIGNFIAEESHICPVSIFFQKTKNK